MTVKSANGSNLIFANEFLSYLPTICFTLAVKQPNVTHTFLGTFLDNIVGKLLKCLGYFICLLPVYTIENLCDQNRVKQLTVQQNFEAFYKLMSIPTDNFENLYSPLGIYLITLSSSRKNK